MSASARARSRRSGRYLHAARDTEGGAHKADISRAPLTEAGHIGGRRSLNGRASAFLLQCMSPLMAQSGHASRAPQCALSGVKQTSRGRTSMSAYDHITDLISTQRPALHKLCGVAPGV